MILVWARDALEVIETDLLEFCWAEGRLCPRHGLRTFDTPHHRQLTFWPTIHPTDASTIFSTNKQRDCGALTLNFVHVSMLSS